MKKPKKEKQLKSKGNSCLFDTCTNYSPQDLRDKADLMDRESVDSIKFEIEDVPYPECHYLNVIEYRYETNEELEKRYNKVLKLYNEYKAAQKTKKEREKAEIIKKAKELGLNVSE